MQPSFLRLLEEFNIIYSKVIPCSSGARPAWKSAATCKMLCQNYREKWNRQKTIRKAIKSMQEKTRVDCQLNSSGCEGFLLMPLQVLVAPKQLSTKLPLRWPKHLCVPASEERGWMWSNDRIRCRVQNPNRQTLCQFQTNMTCHVFVYVNMPHISAKCLALPFPKSQILHFVPPRNVELCILGTSGRSSAPFSLAVVEISVKKSHLLTSTEFPNLLSWNWGWKLSIMKNTFH